MPLGASIVENIATDKIATGNADVGKNIQGGILGTAIDEKFQSNLNPFFREFILKVGERGLENINSGDKEK